MRRSWRWRLNTLQEEKVKDEFEGDEAKQKVLEGFVIPITFEGDDKDKVAKAVQGTLDWLGNNQLAEKDEFVAKQKELDGFDNPIMI